ncbi:DNA N-6-adenine-methyltransferase [Arsukibacterium sp.]|uniref:DNA N-6-adenine-methyltransferase n=1 Tax=Arsukibacterium sp. TaxID=1977258 RepID=UPI002FD90BE9
MNFNSNTPLKEKDLAQTPVWFYESLQSYLRQRFTLDVCAQPGTAKCVNYFALEDGANGLELPWCHVNFCNPPFSDITPWIEKAVHEAKQGNITAMIFPDTTETEYGRLAWDYADTLIRMPFRLKFLRPDGTKFLDAKGKEQGPKFPCVVAWFTPMGLVSQTRVNYYDFRIGNGN